MSTPSSWTAVFSASRANSLRSTMAKSCRTPKGRLRRCVPRQAGQREPAENSLRPVRNGDRPPTRREDRRTQQSALKLNYEADARRDTGSAQKCSSLILLALPTLSRFVLAALAPTCPRPRVWLARASVHRWLVAPHSCWARAVDRRTGSCRSRPRDCFGNLTELHANVALAHVRAHGFREHANADLELRRHLNRASPA